MKRTIGLLTGFVGIATWISSMFSFVIGSPIQHCFWVIGLFGAGLLGWYSQNSREASK